MFLQLKFVVVFFTESHIRHICAKVSHNANVIVYTAFATCIHNECMNLKCKPVTNIEVEDEGNALIKPPLIRITDLNAVK